MEQALAETAPLVLQLSPAVEMTEQQFFEFCQLNRDLRIERTARGELVIMSPAGSETGNKNLRLSQQLANWTDTDGTGIAFDSSAGFKLPNGATRSPDGAWLRLEKWNALSQSQRTRFAPLCPDFVIELLSPSDRLSILQEKLAEYISNGTQLGWLIDPKNREVYVYRPGVDVERLDNPSTLSDDSVLPGFVLNLQKIW